MDSLTQDSLPENRLDQTKLCEIFPGMSAGEALNRLANLCDRYLKSLHTAVAANDQTSIRASIVLIRELAQMIDFHEMSTLSTKLEISAFEKNWLHCKVLLEAMKLVSNSITEPNSASKSSCDKNPELD